MIHSWSVKMAPLEYIFLKAFHLAIVLNLINFHLISQSSYPTDFTISFLIP